MANGQTVPFGALLKRYQAAAQLTQKQLAASARLSPDTIAALERGKRHTLREAAIQRLAAGLGLTGAERAALLAAAQSSTPGAWTWATLRLPLPALLTATQPTPLIDRAGEAEVIRQCLGDEGARLLTLTGPAGVGKTRLALAAAAQVADRFPDGVTLVDLARIRDSQLVLSTMARALGLTDAGPSPLPQRLQAHLCERATLLLLDNFEQVLPAAAQLADLLAACPRLTLLVTSRIPLQLRWERTLRVPPLPVPNLGAALPPPDELAQVPSVALFVERAQAHRADFVLTAAQAPLVAQLVAQLDGLPLALELAAARLDALSLPQIARRLEDRLRLLRWEAPDLPERQRSLEAALDWSYDLLGDDEQRLFRGLGVFMCRVSLDAIAAVGASAGNEGGGADEERALDGMTSLAEKSLVLPGRQDEDDDDPEPVFSMLETVREYAREQLTRLGELPDARARHAHYFLALAERADPQLRGRDQHAWYLRLEREHDNLQAALRWPGSGGCAATMRRAGAGSRRRSAVRRRPMWVCVPGRCLARDGSSCSRATSSGRRPRWRRR